MATSTVPHELISERAMRGPASSMDEAPRAGSGDSGRGDGSFRREVLLRKVTEALIGTLDPVQAAARLAELVVPGLADWAVVTLLDRAQTSARRQLRHAAACHRDPAHQSFAERYATTRLPAMTPDALPAQVLRTGRPAFLAGGGTAALRSTLRPGPARELVTVLAPEHLALLPLPGRDGPVGLLSLHNGAARGPFTAAELATADVVAARAGLIVNNASLYQQQRAVAEALQHSMLTSPLAIDGLQIAVRYSSAASTAQIGGDWYDAFPQHAGATLVIGDVAGHDTSAAATMGQVRTLLRGIAVATQAGPARLLGAVDAAMADLQVSTLTTALVARLTRADEGTGPRGWQLRWSSAGHPPPLVVHADGRVTTLDGHADRPLGISSNTRRQESLTHLEDGSVLLLYTDGLVERRDRSVDDGIARLGAVVSGFVNRGTVASDRVPPASGLPDLHSLCDSVLAQMLDCHSDDDVALLAVRVLPAGEARRGR